MLQSAIVLRRKSTSTTVMKSSSPPAGGLLLQQPARAYVRLLDYPPKTGDRNPPIRSSRNTASEADSRHAPHCGRTALLKRLPKADTHWANGPGDADRGARSSFFRGWEVSGPWLRDIPDATARRSSARWPSLNGPATGSCVIRASSGFARTSPRATSFLIGR